jgi:hypothetical protein
MLSETELALLGSNHVRDMKVRNSLMRFFHGQVVSLLAHFPEFFIAVTDSFNALKNPGVWGRAPII